jgi:sulfite exporter TauE/SafE
MDSGAAIVTGLVLGLSSGGHCFWSCAAVMGPYMVATDAGEISRRWSTVGGCLRALGWYNLGRLLAYLAVGIAVALVAGTAALPVQLQAIALVATAGLLGYSVVRPAAHGVCWQARRRSVGAFAIGLFQGVSPCPPFLVAVGIALSKPGVGGGILLFLSLFVGTALYTLPLAFLEPLRRSRWLFGAMRAVGAVVCVYLLARAALLLYEMGL